MNVSASKIGSYTVHPVARWFPLMGGSEFEEFKANLRDFGQQDAIVVLGKTLLDGRNRLRACIALEIEPKIREYDGELDPLDYIISQNLHRRHLNDSQRGMVGAQIARQLKTHSKEVQQEAGRKAASSGGKAKAAKAKAAKESGSAAPAPETNRPQGQGEGAERTRAPASRDVAAKMVGTSGMTVQRSIKVLEHGVPELQAAVHAGMMKTDLAAKVADRDKDEQREIIRRLRDQPTRNPKAIVTEFDREQQQSDETDSSPATTTVEAPKSKFEVLVVHWPAAGLALAEDVAKLVARVVAPCAADTAVAWLQVSCAQLLAGEHQVVLEAMGFTAKTVLQPPEHECSGDWLRGKASIYVMAVKGRPGVRLGANKRPESLHEFVELLCAGERVEFFGPDNNKRDGWTCVAGE